MPVDQRDSVRDKIRFIGGQDTAEISEVVKLARFGKWRIFALNLVSEYGPVLVHTEKNSVIRRQVGLDMSMAKQRDSRRLTGRKTFVVPDRCEARRRTGNCLRKPLRVFPSVAGSINKCACKYIVAIHA